MPRAVQLERALGLAAREHRKCLRVVKRDIFDIDSIMPRVSLHALHGVSEYCEVFDAEEVELQKPARLRLWSACRTA